MNRAEMLDWMDKSLSEDEMDDVIDDLYGRLDQAYDMIILLMKQREWGAATGALYEDSTVKRARAWTGR